jgi:branched-chain amino acid transport system ATP-binding protein
MARAPDLSPDGPAAGLDARKPDLNGLLLDLRREHALSILLIEHDMSVVMQISDSVIVDHGVCISAGTPEQVRAIRP